MASGIQDPESSCRRPRGLLRKADEWIPGAQGEAPGQPLGSKKPEPTQSSLGPGRVRGQTRCPCLLFLPALPHLPPPGQLLPASHTLVFPPVCSLCQHTWRTHSCVHTATPDRGSPFKRSKGESPRTDSDWPAWVR